MIQLQNKCRYEKIKDTRDPRRYKNSPNTIINTRSNFHSSP